LKESLSYTLELEIKIVKVLVCDVETKAEIIKETDDSGKIKKVVDNSPFNATNYLVSCNWRKIDFAIIDGKLEYTIGENNSSVFRHNDIESGAKPDELQAALDWADMMVAHNAKYDVMWLLESGFKLPAKIYCTLVGEYILARGTRVELSLEQTALRRKVTHKKADLTKAYWDDGIGFEAMPLPIVLEYAEADVLSCAETFICQQQDWLQLDNTSLVNIVELMNDMLLFIVEIERNGCSIDLERLDAIGLDYEKELVVIEKRMIEIASEVMGDTPINLRSNADISKIIYSREVVERDLHKHIFNIGIDSRGKKLHPPRMTDNQFVEAVRRTTRRVYKTDANHCEFCHGKGYIRKTKKDGTPFAKPTKCKICDGAGFLYLPNGHIAGLKLIPNGPASASINGFVCDKEDIDKLIIQAKAKGNAVAVEFLIKKKRLNAINTYLSSFVKGIKRWCRLDNILHAGFNQCVTKTGRLSSSNPNFQNLPKERKFPVRSAIISRFKDGEIMECDFSGLEFVVAGELSRDPQIISDILSGKDIHRQTASIVLQKPATEVTKDERNSVKPETFKPLYGGQGNAYTPPHVKKYYDEFFNIYKRHGEWQKEQMDAVLKHGKLRAPSGREYMFPGTRRIRGGQTTNATMIKNYLIQGFATADIVPLACIRLLRRFRELGLKSLLILTVHDSAISDVYPGERQQVIDAFKWAFTECAEEIKSRWGHDMVMPLKAEISVGKNWMELEALH
jgi:DNA polymerase I-like protein with 3'-5' exonuclease and polymerase domains